MMEERSMKYLTILGLMALLNLFIVNADDPYRFFTWTVTYGTISPLGVPQQVGFSPFFFGIIRCL